MPTPSPLVVDNPDAGRFELRDGDTLLSSVRYHRAGDTLSLDYVETPPEARGQGRSSQLMRGVLDDVRTRGLTVTPVCWVAVKYLEDHPEDGDLVAS